MDNKVKFVKRIERLLNYLGKEGEYLIGESEKSKLVSISIGQKPKGTLSLDLRIRKNGEFYNCPNHLFYVPVTVEERLKFLIKRFNYFSRNKDKKVDSKRASNILSFITRETKKLLGRNPKDVLIDLVSFPEIIEEVKRLIPYISKRPKKVCIYPKVEPYKKIDGLSILYSIKTNKVVLKVEINGKQYDTKLVYTPKSQKEYIDYLRKIEEMYQSLKYENINNARYNVANTYAFMESNIRERIRSLNKRKR